MKQKKLTDAQLEVLGKIENLIKEAKVLGVGFIYDNDDCSLSAFNAENVIDVYSGRDIEDEEDEIMNWDEIFLFTKRFDYFDSGMQNLYLHFNDEAL